MQRGRRGWRPVRRGPGEDEPGGVEPGAPRGHARDDREYGGDGLRDGVGPEPDDDAGHEPEGGRVHAVEQVTAPSVLAWRGTIRVSPATNRKDGRKMATVATTAPGRPPSR